ncbi:hypothetical protein PBY51_017954 [Eleginops maclovinus]|uniref:C-type lectin domain-containing protein n=1 Tax=Eleginops maclovinus TaxID=56733 RepID=A0AAN8AJT0_ELEMC|nr:hypothetical protein PBY51_017954 [Eleginops maclovinus]
MGNYGSRTQKYVWWIGAAAVCLGLLIIIVCIVAHNSSVLNQKDLKREQLISNLTMERNTMRDKLEQINMNSSNLTKEMEVLLSKYNAMAVSQDKLREEVNRLRTNKTSETCHQGWKPFKDKCYYFSAAGLTKTWQDSRQDCQKMGADLAIITTREELDFFSKTEGVIWIGLSDMVQEGVWRWVNGNDMCYLSMLSAVMAPTIRLSLSLSKPSADSGCSEKD